MNPRVRFDDEADTEYRFAGRLVRRLPADLPARRRAVTRFPYHVVYLEMASHIRILAIAHDRRRPGYWKGRLK